jgi:hypothetical protein
VPKHTSTPVAQAIPFNKTGLKFNSEDTQAAIEELRTKTTVELEQLTTSLNGNHNILVDNSNIHIVRGSATGYSVTLPDATLLFIGRKFEVVNDSTQPVTLKDNSGAVLTTLISGDTTLITLEINSVSAGNWIVQTITNSATGITSFVLTSNTIFTTSSTTDVIITGFSITPVQGRYSVFYSSNIVISTNNNIASNVIYINGSPIENTRRSVQGVGADFNAAQQTIGEITVNGSQAVDVRVKITSGTLEIDQRSLVLIRLGS